MEYLEVMQFLQALQGVDDETPDVGLIEELLLLLVVVYLVVEVAVVRELHHDAA